METAIGAMDVGERRHRLSVYRQRFHRECLVCGADNRYGLHIDFRVLEDGTVAATTVCGTDQEGYPGKVHGGILSMLLDGALTNCLFSYGVVAVTGELKVRMRQPVAAGAPIRLRAWLEQDLRPLYIVRAELHQHEVRAAWARGKFMDLSFASQPAGDQRWQDPTSGGG